MTEIESPKAQKETKPTSAYVEGKVDTIKEAEVSSDPSKVESAKDVRRIGGEKITAGRISSSDGLTYFDLDVNKRIVINDGTTNRLIIGKNDSDVVVSKLSQATYDVLTATDDQLIWSADFNLFKIVSVVTATINTGGVAVEYSSTINHNLGYKPMVFGSVESSYDSKIRPLPSGFFGNGATYREMGAFSQVEGVSTTQLVIKLDILSLLGLSTFGANDKTMTYKLYLCRETIA